MVDEELGQDFTKMPPDGAVYIRIEDDIFVLILDRLAEEVTWECHRDKIPYGGWASFGRRSASLTPLQCLDVKRVMLLILSITVS
jgi:hypothetical protein